MGDSQLAIKIILIGVFAAFGLLLLLPERGSRRLAIKRIALLLFFGALALGVAFPGVVDILAKFLGVGRGTDLLLYALLVVFIGQSISTARRGRQFERRITLLARRAAMDREQSNPPRAR